MKQLLVHGCYDAETLETLINLGVNRFAFDLRATSTNLIPFSQLQSLLQRLNGRDVIVTFQNDKPATVNSFVDLLKTYSGDVALEFRDAMPAAYYEDFKRPFYWMFSFNTDWRAILSSPYLKGVLLPLSLRSKIQPLAELWRLTEEREIEVFLHSEVMGEAWELASTPDINVSIELTREVERSYRSVDQERLKKMKLWRLINESPTL